MPMTTRSKKRALEQKAEEAGRLSGELSRHGKRAKSKDPMSLVDSNLTRDLKLDMISNSVTCSVCMLFFRKPIQLIPCSHVFCNSCISKWLIRKRSCPCCRSEPSKLVTDVALQSILSAFYDCASASTREVLECDREELTCEMVSGEEMSLQAFVDKYKRIFRKVYNQRNIAQRNNSNRQQQERSRGLNPELERTGGFAANIRVVFGREGDNAANTNTAEREAQTQTQQNNVAAVAAGSWEEATDFLSELQRLFLIPPTNQNRRQNSIPSSSEDTAENSEDSITDSPVSNSSDSEHTDASFTSLNSSAVLPSRPPRPLRDIASSSSSTSSPGALSSSESRGQVSTASSSRPATESLAGPNDVIEVEGVRVAPSDMPDVPTAVILGGLTADESLAELIARVMFRGETNWDDVPPAA